MTTDKFLKQYNLKTLSLATASTWMNALGYSYNKRKKCYYNDNHKKPENITYCNNHIHHYLNKIEPLTHRYIQMTKQQYIQYKSDNLIHQDLRGYDYTNDDGVEMVEHHVDDSPLFQSLQSELPFGGALSVHKPEDTKALIILGQDKCIYEQYKF
jgi:hypothetical protein